MILSFWPKKFECFYELEYWDSQNLTAYFLKLNKRNLPSKSSSLLLFSPVFVKQSVPSGHSGISSQHLERWWLPSTINAQESKALKSKTRWATWSTSKSQPEWLDKTASWAWIWFAIDPKASFLRTNEKFNIQISVCVCACMRRVCCVFGERTRVEERMCYVCAMLDVDTFTITESLHW